MSVSTVSLGHRRTGATSTPSVYLIARNLIRHCLQNDFGKKFKVIDIDAEVMEIRVEANKVRHCF